MEVGKTKKKNEKKEERENGRERRLFIFMVVSPMASAFVFFSLVILSVFRLRANCALALVGYKKKNTIVM
jgi:hypothetical protein